MIRRVESYHAYLLHLAADAEVQLTILKITFTLEDAWPTALPLRVPPVWIEQSLIEVVVELELGGAETLLAEKRDLLTRSP